MTGSENEKFTAYETIIDCMSKAIEVPKIRWEYVKPPIPVRNLDWEAWFDGWEEPIGTGATLKDAIEDLFDKYCNGGTNKYLS